MNCKKCNAVINKDALFCPNCGNKTDRSDSLVGIDKTISVEEMNNLEKKKQSQDPSLNQNHNVYMPPMQVQNPNVNRPTMQGQNPGMNRPPMQGQNPGMNRPPMQGQNPGMNRPPMQGQNPGMNRPPMQGQNLGMNRPPMQGQNPGMNIPPMQGQNPGMNRPPMQGQNPGMNIPPMQGQNPGMNRPPMQGQNPGMNRPPMQGQNPGMNRPPMQGQNPGMNMPPMQGQNPGMNMPPMQGQNPEQDSAKKESENKSRAIKPVRKQGKGKFIACIFLAILLFFSLVASVAQTIVVSSISGKNIENWVDDTQLWELKLTDKNGKSKNLADIMYASISKHSKSNSPINNIDLNKVKKLLDEEFMKDFVKEIVLEYLDYVVSGTKSEGVTPERIADFVIDNKTEIAKSLYGKSTAGFISFLGEDNKILKRDYIEKEARVYMKNGVSIEDIDSKYGSIISKFRFFITSSFTIILWTVTVLLLALIIVLCYPQILNSLVFTGIPALVSGIGSLVGEKVVSGIIMNRFGDRETFIANKISRIFLDKIESISLWLIIIGLVFILARCTVGIVRKIQNKNLPVATNVDSSI